MTLVRVTQADSGDEFSILNLQMITKVECRNFAQGQDEHQATVSFSDGGRVILAGADRVVSALEAFLVIPASPPVKGAEKSNGEKPRRVG